MGREIGVGEVGDGEFDVGAATGDGLEPAGHGGSETAFAGTADDERDTQWSSHAPRFKTSSPLEVKRRRAEFFVDFVDFVDCVAVPAVAAVAGVVVRGGGPVP
ncbi:hypothetical protein GCM10010343_33860 [Streptomyces avidinii]|nr:hypothetical protein GCM10010343_33860 [Streptomyces avidinii]